MSNNNGIVSGFDLRGKQLLIVDDDPIIRMIMRSMFNKWQNTFFDFAINGLEALDKLQKSCFDLIVMDLRMPVLGGFEAAKAIREGVCGEIYQQIPIIAMTSDICEKDKNHSLNMNHILTKPITDETLYLAINSCLSLSQNPDPVPTEN
jgi:CheY-like chemotaxis protein